MGTVAAWVPSGGGASRCDIMTCYTTLTEYIFRVYRFARRKERPRRLEQPVRDTVLYDFLFLSFFFLSLL